VNERKKVTGGCHCGAVRFAAEVDLGRTLQCNCTYCEKKGFLLTFTPAENFAVTAGADRLTEYRFNRNVIAHQFCSRCGVQAFSFGKGPDGKAMAAVNTRCIDGIELAALSPQPFDGRSL